MWFQGTVANRSLRGALAAFIAIIAAFVFAVSSAEAAATNSCTTTGVTTAVAVKIFGAGTKCGPIKRSKGEISAGGVANDYVGLDISVWPKSYLATWLKGITIAPVKLSGLGASAGLFNSPAYNYCTLYFAAGPYTVLLGTTDGGLKTSPKDGVTKKEIEALAHAIYKHLS